MSHIPSILKSIRGEATDTFNRLHSIFEDSRFVLEVAERYPSYPLFANQRCGAWYAPQARPEFVYFKSTDGHFGQWSFNLRRANMHLLPIVQASGGIVIVDSTRGGKSMPDALSKTIPLWCAVINEAIIRSQEPQPEIGWDIHGGLNTAPACVGSSEHEQMAGLVPGLAEALIKSSFDLPHLSKPLRPFWVTKESSPHSFPTDCLPIVCVAASKQVAGGMERRDSNYTYVRGAADDHETWSNGLTPAMFWAHEQEILPCGRDSITEIINGIVESYCTMPDRRQPQEIDAVSGQILISTLGDRGNQENQFGIIQVRKPPPGHRMSTILLEPNRLIVEAHEEKKDKFQFLHQVLPAVDSFGRQWLHGGGGRLIVMDEDGDYDTSVGILMLLLARFFDDFGKECPRNQPCEVSKDSLRRRLEWIQQSVPQANPSRTTMKRINEYAISSLRQIHRRARDPYLLGAQSGD